MKFGEPLVWVIKERPRRTRSQPPASQAPPRKKLLRRLWLAMLTSLLVSITGAFALWLWFITAPALPAKVQRPIVNDVTQLNPIAVTRIVHPRTIDDVRWLMRTTTQPVAIGGGHYSMGGQTACEGCISLDMRKLDRVLDLDVAHKRVRVEAGITWRKLQDAIDKHDLAISIMQTYANFTVGGALSVNAHGRYIGGGPVIHSVQSIELVLADGSLVSASPTEHSDLFYGAIGGYGGIGVIVTATLKLADNTRIQRDAEVMPVREYREHFATSVRDDKATVFHNADLYPPAYDTVNVQTWRVTEQPLTIAERFVKPEPPSTLKRALLYWVTDLPLGPQVRQHLYDPWVFHEDMVVLRNHEASYDVIELEPASRKEATYVLQEYFVPVAQLDAFVPKLRDVLRRYDVSAVNVSIRHAHADTGSLLAWAPEEVFSFVLYYKQGTSAKARAHVATWTRAAIDAVLSVGGRYYLPYQPHATQQQFERAYPRFNEYVALKRRVDPGYRFRNKLWDTYLPPDDPAFRARTTLHKDGGALRGEGQTFLTLPEWHIVFAADEYATHLAHAPPSAFPYVDISTQLWSLYRDMHRRTRDHYPPNSEYHVMNAVICTSQSIENLIKGAYESTVGRLTEPLACEGDWALCNAEDRYAAQVAREYDSFIRTYPWYEFPYAKKLKALWALDTTNNHSWIRGWERRLFLSAEYGLKTLYADAIRNASQSAYGVEELTTRAWITRPESTTLPQGVTSLQRFGTHEVVQMPRYEGFRDAALQLIKAGASFREIAGNDHVAFTVVVPRGYRFKLPRTELTRRWPVLTDPSRDRAMLFMPVNALHTALPSLQADGATIDHVFDY